MRPLLAAVLVFTNVAREARVTAVSVNGGDTTKKYLIETTGSGVAFVDYDHDGWLDLFVLTGSRLGGSPATNVLYRNQRDGTFRDMSREAGLARSGWGQGVCAGDYDNDGYTDLFVTYWGSPNVLYHNLGGRGFEDASRRAGLRGEKPRWSTGCAFLDYDRDGLLDLFVANYLVQDLPSAPLPGQNPYCWYRGIPVACGPRGLPFDTNQLFHNNGDGTFTEVTEKAGIAIPGRYSLGVLTADFDNDGWTDIYVACDQTPSILYHNNHDGTFTDVALLSGVALGEDGKPMSGMGAAAADYDSNGWFDIFRSNFSDEIESLYQNRGRAQFDDATRRAGLGHNTRYVGWGCGFLDADNDGRPDLFLANGHVFPEVDRLGIDVRFRDRSILYRNLGDGKFQDVSTSAGPGLLERHSSRGVAFGDYDNDGDIDIVVNNQNEPPSLLRNDSRGLDHWIQIRLEGTRSNRSAIGARVRLRAAGREQIDEVRSGSSYLSQSDFRLHFGLGGAEKVDWIEVRWPSGQVDRVENLRANRVLSIPEGKAR